MFGVNISRYFTDMNKPTTEYIRGIAEAILDDYQTNQSNIDVEVRVEEYGEYEFKVSLVYDISKDDTHTRFFTFAPDTIKAIRIEMEYLLDNIEPYKPTGQP